jgi:hypothetical protein
VRPVFVAHDAVERLAFFRDLPTGRLSTSEEMRIAPSNSPWKNGVSNALVSIFIGSNCSAESANHTGVAVMGAMFSTNAQHLPSTRWMG